MGQQPLVGKDLRIIEASQSQTHRNLLDFSGREISPTQRLPPDNKQRPQKRDNHTSCWNRTRNSTKRPPANPRLRPRGHWDRPFNYLLAHHTTNTGINNHKWWITWLAKYLKNYLLFGWLESNSWQELRSYVRQQAEPGPASKFTFQGIKWPEPETKRLVFTLGLHTACVPHMHSRLKVEAQ